MGGIFTTLTFIGFLKNKKFLGNNNIFIMFYFNTIDKQKRIADFNFFYKIKFSIKNTQKVNFR